MFGYICLPVDKNRSTTGGQSGPPYLQLWLQQEDSPDHASWATKHSSIRGISLDMFGNVYRCKGFLSECAHQRIWSYWFSRHSPHPLGDMVHVITLNICVSLKWAHGGLKYDLRSLYNHAKPILDSFLCQVDRGCKRLNMMPLWSARLADQIGFRVNI